MNCALAAFRPSWITSNSEGRWSDECQSKARGKVTLKPPVDVSEPESCDLSRVKCFGLMEHIL